MNPRYNAWMNTPVVNLKGQKPLVEIVWTVAITTAQKDDDFFKELVNYGSLFVEYIYTVAQCTAC